MVFLRPGLWSGRERFGSEVPRTFLDFNATTAGHRVESLGEAAGPSDCCPDGAPVLCQAKEKLLGVLRQKSGTSLDVLRLPQAPCFDCHCGADRVAIAFVSSQTQDDRVADTIHRETQDSNLLSISVLQNDFESTIAIEVGERKRSAVVSKIQSHHARNIGKRAIAIVGKKNVPFVTVPGRVRTDEFIDRAPPALIARRRGGILR